VQEGSILGAEAAAVDVQPGVAAMLAPPVAAAPLPAPAPSLCSELAERHGDAVLLIEARRAADGSETLLAVLNRGPHNLHIDPTHCIPARG
jgi:hypothetical protein